MTTAEAKRYAKSLHDWRYSNIVIHTAWQDGETWITCETPVGTKRIVRTQADLIELRECAAAR